MSEKHIKSKNELETNTIRRLGFSWVCPQTPSYSPTGPKFELAAAGFLSSKLSHESTAVLRSAHRCLSPHTRSPAGCVPIERYSTYTAPAAASAGRPWRGGLRPDYGARTGPPRYLAAAAAGTAISTNKAQPPNWRAGLTEEARGFLRAVVHAGGGRRFAADHREVCIVPGLPGRRVPPRMILRAVSPRRVCGRMHRR